MPTLQPQAFLPPPQSSSVPLALLKLVDLCYKIPKWSEFKIKSGGFLFSFFFFFPLVSLFVFLLNPNIFCELICSTALPTVVSVQLRLQQTGIFNWKWPARKRQNWDSKIPERKYITEIHLGWNNTVVLS